MEPVRFLYMLDFVDIFTVIIAIHVGPLQAVAFNMFWNMYTKLAGAYLTWIGTAKDAFVQSFITLFVPLIHIATGGNLVATVAIFSLIRAPLYFLVSLVIPHRSIPEQIFQCIVAGGSVLVINAFYAKIFGDFFENLLKKGAQFSWILFFAATVIILLFAIFFMGFSPKKTSKKIVKRAVNIARRKPVHQNTEHHDREMEEMRRIRDNL